jgi:Cytochrome c oxidase subunit IV
MEVRVYARVTLAIAAYLLIGGLVYGASNTERIGLVLLLIAGSGFAYLGLYARRAIRTADRAAARAVETGTNEPALAEPEVRPTIWPLVFSLAGAAIVAGVLASHWLLIAAALLFVAAAIGWFRDVLAQRAHEHREP